MSDPSYWHTALSAPLKWWTIPQLIDKWAEKKPDDEAYVVRMTGAPREAVTFKQLQQKTEAFAAGILELGLQPGDFVLITGISCLNWILIDLACISVGIITLRCEISSLTKEGLLTTANQNNAKAIFFHPGENGELYIHLKKCIPDAFENRSDAGTFCKDIPSLEYLLGMASFEDLITVDKLLDHRTSVDHIRGCKAKVSPDSMATVYMTSGSTGFPKLIPYSHFAWINIFKKSRAFQSIISEDDRVFNERSLAWIGSLFNLPLVYGCAIVYVHPLTNASDSASKFCIQAIHEERVNSGIVLQYLIIDIVTSLATGKHKPFYWRWAATGGDALQETTIKSAARFTERMLFVYGMTECLIVAQCLETDLNKCLEYSFYIDHGVEVKIINNVGEVVKMGEIGEIVIRSPLAFKGYLHDDSTALSKDGWFKTDDMGCLDKEYVKVFGRKSQVISRGGVQVYPVIPERIIFQFPGVRKVVVIGVPEKRLGENICACIIPTEGTTLTSDDMLRCFDDMYKTDEGLGITPAYFMFLTEFPTVNSKIDKKRLQKMAIERFSLN